MRVTSVSVPGQTWLAILEGGHRLRAYRDQGKVWTIGAGIVAYPFSKIRVKKGDVLESVEVAQTLFRAKLHEYEVEVDARTRDDITQTEFDALTSFCYNIGVSEFRTCTALKRFNDRSVSPQKVAEAMGWYRNITVEGVLQVDPGLVERRKCEAYLLMFGLYRTQGEKKG